MSRRVAYFRKRLAQSKDADPGFPNHSAVSTGRTQRCKVTEHGDVERFGGCWTDKPGTKPMKDEKRVRILAMLNKK